MVIANFPIPWGKFHLGSLNVGYADFVIYKFVPLSCKVTSHLMIVFSTFFFSNYFRTFVQKFITLILMSEMWKYRESPTWRWILLGRTPGFVSACGWSVNPKILQINLWSKVFAVKYCLCAPIRVIYLVGSISWCTIYQVNSKSRVTSQRTQQWSLSLTQ